MHFQHTSIDFQRPLAQTQGDNPEVQNPPLSRTFAGIHLLLPVGRQLLGLLVVSGQAVHSALDENEAELGVLVLAVALQMLAHSQGLLDQVVQVLGDLGSKACGDGVTFVIKLMATK